MAERELPKEYHFNGRTYKPHPAADCFPLMVGAAYKDLIDDIRENGLQQPLLVLGDYLLDGRNRVLAGLEAGLSMFPVTELPSTTDAIVVVASLNIHRRQLTSTQRSNAAANLRELARAAYLDNNPGAVDPDSLPEAEDFTAADMGVGPEAASSSGAAAPAAQPAESPDDFPPLPGGQAPADLAEANGGPGLSQRKLADAYGVSAMSVSRAERVREAAPDLRDPMRDDVITLHDAMRIQHEPEDVRRQAVQDVRDGKATTAVAAIRERYQRDPVVGPNGGSSDLDASAVPAETPPGELAVPPALLGHVRTLLGGISFDPCSAVWCAERVDAAEWCGAEQDGLLAEWKGSVWVFPPPDRAEPFLVKTLLELDAGHVRVAAVLVPMEPWGDATLRAFGSPAFKGLVVPASPITCKRPDGSTVRPDKPLWLLLFGDLQAVASDVFRTFAAAVLVPQIAK